MDRFINKEAILTPRVKKLKEGYLNTPVYISSDRSRILTEYWKETEGSLESIYIKRAKAFERIMEEMKINIFEGELIVGGMTHYRRGCNFYPEWQCEWLENEIDEIGEMSGNYTKIKDESTRKQLLDQTNYWKGRDILTVCKKTWRDIYGSAPEDTQDCRVNIDYTPHPGPTRKIPDHPKILNMGLTGVMAEIEEKLNGFKPITCEDIKKWNLWKAMLITCNAVIKFAGRYSRMAKEMADNEKDSKRKEELEKISEICRWVPENPPRTFWESIQCFYFIHIAIGIEATLSGNSPGRFDQYMYPFYRRDIEEGSLNGEKAGELLACLWIKFNEYHYLQKGSVSGFVQGSPFQNLCIGGIKPENGEDASNELSMLILEVTQHVRLPQPTVSVRYNDKLKEDFLLKTAETVRSGGGQPTFFNDKYAFSVLPYYGIPVYEVRNWAPVGCVEMSIPGCASLFWGTGFIAIPKCLEWVLHNGFDPYIKKQVGKETGDPLNFTSFEQVWEALTIQIGWVMEVSAFLTAQSETNYPAEYAPVIFHSVTTNDCIKDGREINQGGARYTFFNGMAPVGMMTGTNSLIAIKKLVFEDKVISMKELIEALDANFQGKEEIKKLCLDAPKYGNDDNYADEMAQRLFKVCNELVTKHTNPFGETLHNLYAGITAHYYHGAATGATPDGRVAYYPYGDGSVSPVQGTDKKGPTTVIRSAGKIDAAPSFCTLFNQKFHPSALNDMDGLKKFLAYLKTYMDLAGYHIQFNCVDRETLLKAKERPDEYRDLVVRVAGFCHFFTHLSPLIQDEIIERTEQNW